MGLVGQVEIKGAGRRETGRIARGSELKGGNRSGRRRIEDDDKSVKNILDKGEGGRRTDERRIVESFLRFDSEDDE